MKVYLAATEMSEKLLNLRPDDDLSFGLASYYYLRDDSQLQLIVSKIKESLLIDSGAHSFQHGKKVDFLEYTKKYADFIRKHTNNNKIEGFFEMDIDNVVGYEKVLEYRKILESVSDKIIPVWHNNRGVDDFVEMCKKYKGKKIAITGFANNDIKDSQYNLFINTAHKYGCKIHILGLTRYELIKDLNLGVNDSVDSSSWRQTAIFGGVNLPLKNKTIYKLSALEGMKIKFDDYLILNYFTAKIIQEMYKDEDYSV